MNENNGKRHWINLSEANIRDMLIALIGLEFGPEPEKHIPEIRDSRKNFANYIADEININSKDIVLDLGSGCGFGSYWFAQRAKHVHACDISPAYLSFAQRELSELENVSFHLIEPYQLDCLDTNSIDVVCSMSVFIHFNLYDIYWYFNEFVRVLKPGGRIWIDIADSESLDLKSPNTTGGYFLKHAQDYRADRTNLAGLMQWNSIASIINMAKHFGFKSKKFRSGGQLLFIKL